MLSLDHHSLQFFLLKKRTLLLISFIELLVKWRLLIQFLFYTHILTISFVSDNFFLISSVMSLSLFLKNFFSFFFLFFFFFNFKFFLLLHEELLLFFLDFFPLFSPLHLLLSLLFYKFFIFFLLFR